MRSSKRLIFFAILAVAFGSCFEPPQFSSVPYIDTPVLYFHESGNGYDSIVLSINFKDGDGDLGFTQEASDNEGHYSNKFYYLSDGTPVYFKSGYPASKYVIYEHDVNDPSSVPPYAAVPELTPSRELFDLRFLHPFRDSLISYQNKRVDAQDTLPEFVPPFDCTRWEVVKYDSGNIEFRPPDTVYTTINKYHYNIFVDLYTQETDHSFRYFDFDTEFNYGNPACSEGLKSRFPILSSDLSKPAPLEGKIRYDIISPLWKPYFNSSEMILKVTIQDRAGHRSNVLTTSQFDLQSITKN